MSTVIRTDEVSAGDRDDFVQDIMARTWVPMHCWFGYRPDGWAEFRASGVGPMGVVVVNGTSATVTRTPRLISEADPDMLKLVLVCGTNPCAVEQDGRQAYLKTGEFAVYDTRRPYRVECGLDRDRLMNVLTFMFPITLLPFPRNRMCELTAMRVPAGAGLGDLTSQFLLQLAYNVDQYNPAESARLATAALEVLATRLFRELDAQDWGTPEARRHALLTTVQAFIQQHLGDPQLSPATIAAAHHMSLRSLHQLFHGEGLTVAGYIRQQRLHRCRRDLTDPALAGRPVVSIASRWGFSSAGDFSRAFRAAHGLPPAEYRRSALVVNGSAR